MIYIGIDPGLDGAVVAVDETGKVVFTGIVPTVKISKSKRDYLPLEMHRLLILCKGGNRVDLVVLEKTQAMPGQGSTSMHSLGRGDGLWEGILAAMGIPYTRVHPRTWQKLLHSDIGGTNPKAKSAIAAGRLFPNVDFRATQRCKKMHDGLIDAALLAIYARSVAR